MGTILGEIFSVQFSGGLLSRTQILSESEVKVNFCLKVNVLSLTKKKKNHLLTAEYK